jgi:hypothetical protein
MKIEPKIQDFERSPITACVIVAELPQDGKEQGLDDPSCLRLVYHVKIEGAWNRPNREDTFELCKSNYRRTVRII